MKINAKKLLVIWSIKFVLALLGILAFLLLASWFGNSLKQVYRQYQTGQQLIIIEQENDNHDQWNKDN